MNGIFNLSAAVIIVVGYLFGFYFQNRRIDDLRDSINQRFEGMNRRFDDINQRFGDMNQRFNDLKDFIKAENSRLEDRIERLEHPVARP